MTIELLTGKAAAEAGGESDFAGYRNPRAFRIKESLAEDATTRLSEAFSNTWGSDVRLAEAFTTSDFKLAAFAELDQELQSQYEALPSTWDQYTDTTTVRDFRPKRLKSRGRATVGLARVPEHTEYPADDQRYFSEYAISVAKYGRRKAITWEAWINNEAVQELEDMPAELSEQARETEMIAAVSNLLLVDPKTNEASDVNTTFFKTANGNAPTSLPLTRDNLKAVLDGMAVRKDPGTKRSIARPEVVVVIPKALESQMTSILRPIEVRRTVDGVETIEGNEFSALSYVVEPMLDFVNKNTKAATTWFVVPKPGSARPALWTAKLAGHETPDLRVKADGGQRVGGGDVSPLEGSFEVDDIQYRCRHIVGNQTADALFTYASRGA
ncbi:phage major capsid protein [Nocardioides sp. AX2bis]|uniref:phage major capsid protein n=1 Tax=Nocardioides sp. AX2bis TaxID=2653157 RepID=UPI0012F29591|nr:hypothetical protein [Nocardioides sp. AX2bis]VXC44381.1 conserved hypothetical protein [Nocardioides sp. AX2bis]